MYINNNACMRVIMYEIQAGWSTKQGTKTLQKFDVFPSNTTWRLFFCCPWVVSVDFLCPDMQCFGMCRDADMQCEWNLDSEANYHACLPLVQGLEERLVSSQV